MGYPQMKHPARDADLLLLAHGALPLGPALLTRLHLLRCAGCRARLSQLQAASQLLAGAVRGRDLPRWQWPRPAFPALAAAVVGLLLVLAVGIVLVIGTQIARSRVPAPSGVAAPAPSGPCRPDLPSDRCR